MHLVVKDLFLCKLFPIHHKIQKSFLILNLQGTLLSNINNPEMRTALKKCIEKEKYTNNNIKITMNNKSLLKQYNSLK